MRRELVNIARKREYGIMRLCTLLSRNERGIVLWGLLVLLLGSSTRCHVKSEMHEMKTISSRGLISFSARESNFADRKSRNMSRNISRLNPVAIKAIFVPGKQ